MYGQSSRSTRCGPLSRWSGRPATASAASSGSPQLHRRCVRPASAASRPTSRVGGGRAARTRALHSVGLRGPIRVKAVRHALSQHRENRRPAHGAGPSAEAALRPNSASCSVAGAPEPLARAGPTKAAAASVRAPSMEVDAMANASPGSTAEAEQVFADASRLDTCVAPALSPQTLQAAAHELVSATTSPAGRGNPITSGGRRHG